MPTDPSNAQELSLIARELGAEVLEGALTYPSETRDWAKWASSTGWRKQASI